jgi:hypothetical protein
MDFVETGWDGSDWIGLAQDGENWRPLVNAVVNFGFYRMLGNCRVAAQLVDSGVALSSPVVLLRQLLHPVYSFTHAPQGHGTRPCCLQAEVQMLRPFRTYKTAIRENEETGRVEEEEEKKWKLKK